METQHGIPLDSLHDINSYLNLTNEQIVQAFLQGNLDIAISSTINHSDQVRTDYAQRILNSLLCVPLHVYPQLVKNIQRREKITTADILQFSNMETAMYYIPKLLDDKGDSFTYRELGMLIHPCKSMVAAAKYGENQAKLTMAIALANATKKDGFAAITKSLLTSQFCELSQSDKNDVLQRLCFRIPIVQEVVKYDNWRSALEEKLSFLSESMIKRRKHCCIDIICFALDE